MTEPQQALLRAVATRHRRVTCVETYKPARKLRDLGLVRAESRAFERWELTLTPAGAEVLARGQVGRWAEEVSIPTPPAKSNGGPKK